MLAYYTDDGSRLQATFGLSKLKRHWRHERRRNQLANYGISATRSCSNNQLTRWFAQAYMSQRSMGGTFQLNGLAQNSVRLPEHQLRLSVKQLSAFPGDFRRLQAAEVQNNFSVGMLTQTACPGCNTHFTYGGELRKDRVSSYGHWLSDRATGTPILINQKGVCDRARPLTDMFAGVISVAAMTSTTSTTRSSCRKVARNSDADHGLRSAMYNKAFVAGSVFLDGLFLESSSRLSVPFGNSMASDCERCRDSASRTLSIDLP
jgi:hypothetical protein